MNDKTDINYNLVKKLFLEFVTNKTYMFSIIFFAILSYGFYLINISIGIDDLSISNYVKETYLLASGRYTFVLISWILGYFTFTPFWIEFFCLTVLIGALILINILFKISSNNKLPQNAYIIFSIMFLSYSIIAETLIYQVNAIFLAFGYLFTIISAIYTYKYLFKNHDKSGLLASIFFVLALGLYETFLSVYLILMIIVAILKLYYEKLSIKKHIKKLFIIVMFSVLIKIILQFYLNVFDTPNYSNQNIFWFAYSFKDVLLLFSTSFYKNVLSQVTLYLPFSILMISVLAYIIILVKVKRKIFIPLFVLLFSSIFIIQIIMGAFILNRTMHSMTVYVAFAFCMVYAITKSNKMKNIIFAVVIYMCLLSAKNINNELYKDYKRYNYEKYIVNQTAFMLNSEFGYTEMPVVFIGNMNQPFTNDYNSEIGLSSINWSMNAFNKGMQETQKFFLQQGHHFNLPTPEQIDKANEIYENMPRFPLKGSIKLINDEFIIVRY